MFSGTALASSYYKASLIAIYSEGQKCRFACVYLISVGHILQQSSLSFIIYLHLSMYILFVYIFCLAIFYLEISKI